MNRYLFRGLKKTKRQYLTFNLELNSIVLIIKTDRHILYSTTIPMTVYMDYTNIVYFTRVNISIKIHLNWIDILDFSVLVIRHIPRHRNSLLDIPSSPTGKDFMNSSKDKKVNNRSTDSKRN
jgi:RNase H-like domain found in reverse transcriptase